MGIYDRDYARAPRNGPGFSLEGWTATRWLIAANVVVFLLQNVTPPGTASFLHLRPADVLQGHAWQLLTSLFCHGGLWHLVFNMLFLHWLGSELEALYGPRRFVRLYLLSGLCASLAFVGLAWLQQDPSPALGASGAVLGVTVLYAFHHPRQQILIYGILPIEIRWMVLIYVMMDLSGAMGPGTGIAHASHLGGAAFGAAWALRERRR